MFIYKPYKLEQVWFGITPPLRDSNIRSALSSKVSWREVVTPVSSESVVKCLVNLNLLSVLSTAHSNKSPLMKACAFVNLASCQMYTTTEVDHHREQLHNVGVILSIFNIVRDGATHCRHRDSSLGQSLNN